MPQGFERTAALKREGGGKRNVLGQLGKGRFLWRVEKDFRDPAVGKAAECRRPFAPAVLEIDEFRSAAIGEAFALSHCRSSRFKPASERASASLDNTAGAAEGERRNLRISRPCADKLAVGDPRV